MALRSSSFEPPLGRCADLRCFACASAAFAAAILASRSARFWSIRALLPKQVSSSTTQATSTPSGNTSSSPCSSKPAAIRNAAQPVTENTFAASVLLVVLMRRNFGLVGSLTMFLSNVSKRLTAGSFCSQGTSRRPSSAVARSGLPCSADMVESCLTMPSMESTGIFEVALRKRAASSLSFSTKATNSLYWILESLSRSAATSTASTHSSVHVVSSTFCSAVSNSPRSIFPSPF
mmetsp:Transcript_88749/g.249970  ORF Transcript_88749/g.249970 Transcript_88749/m.249970 type:complete len:234 (-) Transcript_88749:121-822(-)